MEYRTLELNIISAKDLKDANHLSNMNVYAVLSLASDSCQKQVAKAPADRDGGTNPTWNFMKKFIVNESLAKQNRLAFEIKLRSRRTFYGERDIGQVVVPVKELLDQPGDGKSLQFVNYQVEESSGKPMGLLNLSYKLGEKFLQQCTPPPMPTVVNRDEPLMARHGLEVGSSTGHYPSPYLLPHGAYPPPTAQHAAGYGYQLPPPYVPYPPTPYVVYTPTPYVAYPPPPQAAYGHPPQPSYEYPFQPSYTHPTVQQPPRNNRLGGFLGQAFGLLIEDMVSNAAGVLLGGIVSDGAI